MTYIAYDSGTSAFITADSYVPTYGDYITITSANYDWAYVTPPIETEAQREERKRAAAEYEKQQALIREQQAAAKLRAEALLKSHIGLEAYGELLKVGYIELDSQKHKGRKYHVPSNARLLIEVLENGKVVDRLCVHPHERFQDDDEILSRVTLLKYAEEHILTKANHNPVIAH
jgi:hypothetical protein